MAADKTISDKILQKCRHKSKTSITFYFFNGKSLYSVEVRDKGVFFYNWIFTLSISIINLNLSQHLIFQFNNRNTRIIYEICSKLTIKTPERRHQFHTLFRCLHCCLSIRKCRLGYFSKFLVEMTKYLHKDEISPGNSLIKNTPQPFSKAVCLSKMFSRNFLNLKAATFENTSECLLLNFISPKVVIF